MESSMQFRFTSVGKFADWKNREWDQSLSIIFYFLLFSCSREGISCYLELLPWKGSKGMLLLVVCAQGEQKVLSAGAVSPNPILFEHKIYMPLPFHVFIVSLSPHEGRKNWLFAEKEVRRAKRGPKRLCLVAHLQNSPLFVGSRAHTLTPLSALPTLTTKTRASVQRE